MKKKNRAGWACALLPGTLGWVMTPGLALSHCRVDRDGVLTLGAFGWVLDVAPGIALPHCRVGWAGALPPGIFG